MTGPGLYRQAGWLQRGDRVFLAEQGRLRPAEIQSIRRIEGGPRAFNLLVSPGGTFIAEGVVVHNKGCFLPDSPILKGDGQEAPISALRPGDELLAFTPDGRMVRTRVREIMSHQVDELVVLKTDRTTLRTTLDHPFYTGRGTFKTVEALHKGDTLTAWDGRWFSEQRIVSLQRVKGPAQVFNLQTDQPNTFFAGRLAVHNKGGGCFPAGTTSLRRTARWLLSPSILATRSWPSGITVRRSGPGSRPSGCAGALSCGSKRVGGRCWPPRSIRSVSGTAGSGPPGILDPGSESSAGKADGWWPGRFGP